MSTRDTNTSHTYMYLKEVYYLNSTLHTHSMYSQVPNAKHIHYLHMVFLYTDRSTRYYTFQPQSFVYYVLLYHCTHYVFSTHISHGTPTPIRMKIFFFYLLCVCVGVLCVECRYTYNKYLSRISSRLLDKYLVLRNPCSRSIKH